ncbi:MAG: hypothetical protein GWO39_00055, partial [Gammaproteobacteria bacterium]|nr:hypothetical protein [Gammaproteobacteria bacterium]NIT62241.1 hypothetical protein [Gammaproteobacteria bacterium]NIV19071.1 hypothetical protein [Gammaproteobacteria bacterium]NIY30821.1 hypothetical protein [Gammaproteobacteria bacterium]
MKIARTPASLMAQVRVLMMDGDLEKVLDILEEVDRMTPANKDVYYLKKMALEG